MSEEIKQENKRLLEIINAKPLETVDMDCAFEIEKLKEKLQAKEQECERLRKQYNCNACGTCNGKEDYKNMQKHCEKAIAQNHKYKQELKPFKDPYFKGLDNQIIAELAKKSIRLSTENRKLEDALDEIEKIAKNDCENCCECTTEFNLQESCSIYEIQNIINKANTAPTTIFDRIRSFDSDTLARFIHALISCHEKYTCDDCYIASLPFQRRICDTKETLEEIKAWLNEEFKE